MLRNYYATSSLFANIMSFTSSVLNEFIVTSWNLDKLIRFVSMRGILAGAV